MAKKKAPVKFTAKRARGKPKKGGKAGSGGKSDAWRAYTGGDNSPIPY
jgi:hypothetical protein